MVKGGVADPGISQYISHPDRAGELSQLQGPIVALQKWPSLCPQKQPCWLLQVVKHLPM